MLWAKKVLILIGDVLALYLSLALMLVIRYGLRGFLGKVQDHFVPFSIIFLLWIFIFYLANLYRPHTFRSRAVLLSTLTISVLVALIASMIAFYLFGSFFELTPKTNLLIFGAVFIFIGFIFRRATLNIFVSGAIPIVIFGTTSLVEEAVEFLKQNPHAGYRVAFWYKELSASSLETASSRAKEEKVEMVIIAESHLTKEMASVIVQKLLSKEVMIINFWDFYEMVFEKIPLEELEESWFIENVTTRRPIYDSVKRALDLFLGVIFSIAFFLPALLVGALIKVSSRGPVIFSQERTGKNGMVFKVYKFRTMREGNSGPLWTEKNDNRLTTIGKFLRFSHLDEIPQLVNVLKGNISFTGPRPERIELVDQYRKLPYYDMRHVIKPGLTGWAQINYRPSASLEEAYEKLRYDAYYVKNRSLLLDLKIILKTIKYIFTSYVK